MRKKIFSVTLETKNPLIYLNKRVFELYCVDQRMVLSNHFYSDFTVVGEYLQVEGKLTIVFNKTSST